MRQGCWATKRRCSFEQYRAKSLSVGRNRGVKGSCAPAEALGTGADAGTRLSGRFIPRMNRDPHQEGPTAAMMDGLSS